MKKPQVRSMHTTNSKLTSVAVLILTSLSFIAIGIVEALPIVPGESPSLFGMTTPAGSGRHLATPQTNICKVVNLQDTGAGVDTDGSDGIYSGDFRYCIMTVPSPKTVVFEVSGVIDLGEKITIGGFIGKLCDSDPLTVADGVNYDTGNYVTIAGQTAPPPGITLRNYGLEIERHCHDILVQHIRARGTKELFYDMGCDVDPLPVDTACIKSNMTNPFSMVGTIDSPRDVVIDHNTFTWAPDMGAIVSGDYTTFINNVVSESLHNPLHPKGPHSKGVYVLSYQNGVSGGQYVAIINNMISHSVDRNPTVSAGRVVVANNYLYDTGSLATIMVDDTNDSKGPIYSSIVANYVEDTERSMGYAGRAIGVRSRDNPDTRIFVGEDNFVNGVLTQDPWNSGHIAQQHPWPEAGPIPETKIASTPQAAVWLEGYQPIGVAGVKDYVLSHAGAWPAMRDATDARIMANPINGTAHILVSEDDVGGWPTIAENQRTLDIPTNFNTVTVSGYTELEEWLHDYASKVETLSGDLIVLATDPAGQFGKDVGSIPAAVTTSSSAECRFSKNKGKAWVDMTTLATSDNLEHTATIPVSKGEIGQVCYRCMDSSEHLSEETCTSYYIESQPKNPVLISQVLQ